MRSDLLLGKRLRFCYSCCSFYYSTDPEADHPQFETESVQSLFAKAHITYEAILADFLWRAVHNVTAGPSISWTMLSSRHQPRGRGFPLAGGMPN